MAKASGSIDLNAMKEASKVATNCLFEVTNGGVWLTPIDKKPNIDGSPVTSGNNKTSGTLINADEVGIYKDGKCVAHYGENVRIGQSDDYNIKISSSSIDIGIEDITTFKIETDDDVEVPVERTMEINYSISDTVTTTIINELNQLNDGVKFSIYGEKKINGSSVPNLFRHSYVKGTSQDATEVWRYTSGSEIITVSLAYDGEKTFTFSKNGSTSDALAILYKQITYIDSGKSTALYIGNQGSSYLKADYHSLQLFAIGKSIPYFFVSDLRDSDGNVTIYDYFELDYSDTDQMIKLTYNPKSGSSINVNVQGVDVTGDDDVYTQSGNYLTFHMLPNPTNGIIITYIIDGTFGPYTGYTLGERVDNNAIGRGSVALGNRVVASGIMSLAEGYGTESLGNYSHAEGNETTASGENSHAEGQYTVASGNGSHSEGFRTTASGINSNSGGYRTTASGNYSRAYGMHTTASGYFSSANGALTKARAGQFVIGTANIEDTDSNKNYMDISNAVTVDLGHYAFIIGNGYLANNSSGIILDGDDESTIVRSNALTVDWNGIVDAKGGYKVNGKLPIIIERKQTSTISISSKAIHTWTAENLSKTGYTLAGIVGHSVSGTASSACNPYYCRLTGSSSFTMYVSNTGTSTASVQLTVDLLWVANGMI